MLLRIGLALSMALGMSFAHAQDLEDNGPASTAAPAAAHDAGADFSSDVDKATAAQPAQAAHEPATKSNAVGGASGHKSAKKKNKAAAKKKKREPSSVSKKKGKKSGKKKKKHS